MCKKKAYKSLQKAINNAIQIELEYGIKMYEYRCQVCNKYHLTRKGNRKTITEVENIKKEAEFWSKKFKK